jgi:hypothetical protein
MREKSPVEKAPSKRGHGDSRTEIFGQRAPHLLKPRLWGK